MEQFLVQGVLGIALGVTLTLVRARRARRRRTALGSGGTVSLGVRLGLRADRPRPGRLVLAPGRAVWTGRRSGVAVDLGGAEVLSSVPAPGNAGESGLVVLRLLLRDRTPARLQLHRVDAAAMVRLLAGIPPAPAAPPTPPPPRRSWWAITCLTLAGGWLLLVAGMAAGGYSASTTVTGGDGAGTCTVTWEDTTGARHTGEVSCDDQPAGTRIGVRVFGPPDPEDPYTTDDALAVAALVSVPLAAVGGYGLVVARRRRRAWAAAQAPAEPALSAPADARIGSHPGLRDEDLHAAAGESPAALVARLAPHARRQLPDDGWESPRRPAGVRGPLVARRLLVTFLGPVWLLVAVVALTWPWPWRWAVLATTPTATATAVSTGELASKGDGPLPDEVTVRFGDGRGGVRTADVATGRSLPRGTEVPVEYAVDSPGDARISGPGDELELGAGMGAAGLVAGLLWTGSRLRRVVRHVQGVHRAHAEGPRPALGLLTAGLDGSPVLLLGDPRVTPVEFVAVPLETPLPRGTARLFAASPGPQLWVHGRLGAGELVVAEVAGTDAPLIPRAGAIRPGAAALLELLDSTGALARSADSPDGE